MERNVGKRDRLVRIVAGLLVAIAGAVALAGYLAAGALVSILALAVGGILLATGTTQRCPIYAGAGVDTCGEQG